MTVLEAWSVPPKSPSLSVIMEQVRYRVTLPAALAADLPVLAERFLAMESYPYRREKKGGVQEFDLRLELYGLAVDGVALVMEIGRGKPLEFVAAVTGRPLAELTDCRIEKLEVIFKDSSFK
jgi:hypothetical protein